MGSNQHTDSAQEIQLQSARKLAEIALERFDLPDARLYVLRQEGFVQVVRVVSPSKGEFSLRMYRAAPPDQTVVRSDTEMRTGVRLRSTETLDAQLLWLSALGRETDLLVPEPVPMTAGSLLDYVSYPGYRDAYYPEHRGRYCTLLRWVPGAHKREQLSSADLSLLGAYVARLHNHAEHYHVLRETTLPRWGWHWTFGQRAHLWREGRAFCSTSEMAVLEQTAQRVREDLECLGYGANVYGIIHRDLHFGNILFQGRRLFRSRRVGTIDYDTCGLGHYLLDLTVPLDTLRRNHADRFETLQEALLGGYERERTLPEGYQGYIKTFRAMRKVAAINKELRALISRAHRHQALGAFLLPETLKWLQNYYLKDEEE